MRTELGLLVGRQQRTNSKAIRSKVASSTKEFEGLFGIPARTMESSELGLHNVDATMRALLRTTDREPNATRRALAP